MGNPIVSCGMYATTDALKGAWRELFLRLDDHWRTNRTGPAHLTFDTGDATYRDPNLFIGHTCGYPYIKKWQQSHRLVCVPVFDIEGCDGTAYSSWFVSFTDSGVTRIEDARNKRAVINGPMSNSGMNVLRHAVAEAGGQGRFFDEVMTSGSHGASLARVANREADIAAIDAVSYHHALVANPELAERIRIIGQSANTTGLPFICFRDAPFDVDALIPAMNASLESLDEKHRKVLGLSEFRAVNERDYATVADLETRAVKRGYPEVR